MLRNIQEYLKIKGEKIPACKATISWPVLINIVLLKVATLGNLCAEQSYCTYLGPVL
jgi:hypothetical protein